MTKYYHNIVKYVLAERHKYLARNCSRLWFFLSPHEESTKIVTKANKKNVSSYLKKKIIVTVNDKVKFSFDIVICAFCM